MVAPADKHKEKAVVFCPGKNPEISSWRTTSTDSSWLKLTFSIRTTVKSSWKFTVPHHKTDLIESIQVDLCISVFILYCVLECDNTD